MICRKGQLGTNDRTQFLCHPPTAATSEGVGSPHRVLAGSQSQIVEALQCETCLPLPSSCGECWSAVLLPAWRTALLEAFLGVAGRHHSLALLRQHLCGSPCLLGRTLPCTDKPVLLWGGPAPARVTVAQVRGGTCSRWFLTVSAFVCHTLHIKSVSNLMRATWTQCFVR